MFGNTVGLAQKLTLGKLGKVCPRRLSFTLAFKMRKIIIGDNPTAFCLSAMDS